MNYDYVFFLSAWFFKRVVYELSQQGKNSTNEVSRHQARTKKKKKNGYTWKQACFTCWFIYILFIHSYLLRFPVKELQETLEITQRTAAVWIVSVVFSCIWFLLSQGVLSHSSSTLAWIFIKHYNKRLRMYQISMVIVISGWPLFLIY